MTLSPLFRAAPAVLLALGAFALSGCGAPTPAEEPPLAGARIGGAFTLTDQDGQTVTDQDFAGRYRIVYFGYSYCPDVCPVDLQKIAQGLTLFEKQDPARGAAIQPIFITVDPERDTPAVLKRYVPAFHPRLIGLTGSPEEIRAAADTFVVHYSREEGRGPDDYLMSHTNQAYLMDPDGKPLALLPTDQSPQAIADTLAKWTRAG